MIVQLGSSSHSPGKWEFPGGKVNPGETAEEALIREIREELEIEAEIIMPLEPVNYIYPAKKIRLNPFLCRIKSGKVILNEHADFKFITFSEILKYDLLPADLEMVGTGKNNSYLKSNY